MWIGASSMARRCTLRHGPVAGGTFRPSEPARAGRPLGPQTPHAREVGPIGIMQCSARLLLAVGLATLALPARAEAHPGSGIVVDRRGNVYFVISGSNAIMRLDRDGKATTFVSDERLRAPHHLVLGTDGSLYAASDHDGRVWRAATDGSLREYFNSNRVARPEPGRAEVHVGSWGDPFTIDPAGNIYALAAANAPAIIRIAPNGQVTPIATSARFGELHFSSMAWGVDGALYLTDASRVWRIVGDSATPIVPQGVQLSRATGLVVDGDDNIYVADYGSHRVVRFARDGLVNTPRAIERLRLRNPTGVTVAGGDVYVLDSPPGGVAVWRVHDGEAERLYSRRSPQVYYRWALLGLPVLLVVLVAWRWSKRFRRGRQQ